MRLLLFLISALISTSCLFQKTEGGEPSKVSISGSWEDKPVEIESAIAILIYKNDTTQFELFFDTDSNVYSGFVFVESTEKEDLYSVQVILYDEERRTVGVGTPYEFNGLASELKLTTINPLNALPDVDAGEHVVSSINDSVSLTGRATDKFDGWIEKMEWMIGERGDFIETPSGIVELITPNDTGNIIAVFRATDNEGHVVSDTTIIEVVQDIPVISISNDTIVSIYDSILIQVSSTDRFGEVVRWEIKNGNQDFILFSGQDTTFQMSNTPNDSHLVIVKGTDDDGNAGSDTMWISVKRDVPKIEAIYLLNNYVSVSDTVIWEISASDSLGFVKEIQAICDNDSTLFLGSEDSIFYIQAPQAPTDFFECVVTVIDDDANIIDSSVNIPVRSEPHNGMVKINIGKLDNIKLGVDTVAIEDSPDWRDTIIELDFVEYWIDVSEMTVEEYFSIMNSFQDHPLDSLILNKTWNANQSLPVQIGYNNAILFCNERSKLEGLDTVYSYSEIEEVIIGFEASVITLRNFEKNISKNGYRLPRKQEWQYAYNRNDFHTYYWWNLKKDSNIDSHAWHKNNATEVQNPRQKKPNLFGLYDMIGNVGEWFEKPCIYPIQPGSCLHPSFGETNGGNSFIGGSVIQLYYYAEGLLDIQYTEMGTHTRGIGFRTVRNAD